MKIKIVGFVLVIGLLVNPMLWAAQQQVTLKVEGMTCGMCPLTVKSSLKAVKCVSKAEISLAEQTAKVRFDDAQCQVEELIEATTRAGYPSRLKETS